MTHPADPPTSPAPLIGLLLEGQPERCRVAFTQLEQAIWDCVAKRIPAAKIGVCIAAASGTACACCQASASAQDHPALARMQAAIQSCLQSTTGSRGQRLVSAFADEVLRTCACVWQSWQDGYDSGWEDAHSLDAANDSPASPSWLDS